MATKRQTSETVNTPPPAPFFAKQSVPEGRAPELRSPTRSLSPYRGGGRGSFTEMCIKNKSGMGFGVLCAQTRVTLVSPVSPSKTGCTAFIYRGCVTRAP